jgi:signal transduction histidine kinase
VPVLILAVACGFAAWGQWPWLREDPLSAVTFALVGVAFVATGVLLGAEPAQRPNGLLFVACGLLWLANDVGSRLVGVLPALGWALRPVDEMLLIVILLRYPATRIGDRLVRRVVGVGAAAVLVPYYVAGLLWDPFAAGWRGTFWWPTVMRVNDLAYDITSGYNVAAVLLSAAVVALAVRRYVSSRGLARRELRPVLVSAGAVAVAYVVTQTVNLVLRSGDPGPALNVASNLVVLTVPVAFAVTALRRRLDRSAVADLVLNIPQPATVFAVRDALRHALLDPTLEVYIWLPDRQYYTDGDSTVPAVPADGRMRRDLYDGRGGPLAVVLIDGNLQRRTDLVDAAVRAAGLSVENARLHTDLLHQLQELEQSRARIVEAGITERRRVERDLHDGAQQRLLALAATIGRARTVATDPTVRALMEQARGELREALRDLRDLARGIHPAVLEQVGLAAAVETVAEAVPMPVQVAVDTERLPAAVESTAYFVICEALANVVKHARAHRATVTVDRRHGSVRITVDDDGIGGANPATGGGLAGLSDRIAALGGRIHLDSPPAAGTRLKVELPCE